MRRLKEMYPDELVVIGVHSAKFPSERLTENIRQFVMRHGIDHPVVNDAGMRIWSDYAVRAWPTLVLIDPRGRIAGQRSGEILAEDVAQIIEEVIQQNPSAVDRSPITLQPEARLQPERPLRYPAKLLLAGDRLFIADSGHHRILEARLDPDGLGGELLRVIGSGEAALRDGSLETAAFNHPHGMALRGSPDSGTLYVADTGNHAVRAVDLEEGVVRTAAGTGQKAHGRYLLGAPTETPLRSPWAVLLLEGILMIAMAGSHQVWALVDEGSQEQLGIFAGNGVEDLVDGPIAQSSFNQPSDLAYGLGHLFVADPEASAVRAISLIEQARTMTLVGQGLFEFGDQDGETVTALLQHPMGIDFSDGLIYVADTYNHKIKVLDPVAGQVKTLIGSGQAGDRDGPFDAAQLFEPEGLQVYNGKVYIADANNHLIRAADLQAGQVHTFRLRGLDRLPGPAPVEQAQRIEPLQVAPGQVRLVLDVRLPEGYERSPDSPAVVRLGDGSPVYSFAPGEAIAWMVDVRESRSLPVEVTLYYCQAHDARLCLIHDQKLVIPLEVSQDGPPEARIAYTVPAF